MYDGRTVLVTGGTGLIGQQVVRLLQERGARVRVASLDDPSRAPPGVEFRRGNLMDWAFCQEIVRDVDHVFHLAGIKGSTGIGRKRAASFLVPHLLFNTQMMEAAYQAGVERYLFTSSVAVYPPAELFREDDAWKGPPHETDRYAAWAKRIGELQAEAYKVEYGWDRIAIVRPANVYGPYDNFDPATAMVIPALIHRLVSGEDPLVVWGDGSARRDFIFSRDVAEGMLLALEKAADCAPVNLGSGRADSIRSIVETLQQIAPRPPRVEFDASKPAGEAIRRMDTTRAETRLGFRARTSLEKGLRETLHWYTSTRDAAAGRYNVFQQARIR